MSPIHLDRIYNGLSTAETLAKRRLDLARSASEYDSAKFDVETVREALTEYHRLASMWPALRDRQIAQERSYDAYVTNPERASEA